MTFRPDDYSAEARRPLGDPVCGWTPADAASATSGVDDKSIEDCMVRFDLSPFVGAPFVPPREG